MISFRHLRAPTLLLVLSVAALVSVAACSSDDGGDGGKSCTLIGCVGGFEIGLDKGSAWEAGDYTFELDVDGTKNSCTVTLPFANCEVAPKCTTELKTLQIGLSGCMLDKAQHKVSALTFIDAFPAQLSVTVKLGVTEIGGASYTPTYTESRPNGPGCEPLCKQAPAVKLTLK